MKGKPTKSRAIIALMWSAFAILVAAVFIFFFCVYNGIIGYMPPVEELKNPRTDLPRWFTRPTVRSWAAISATRANRVYVDIDDISQNVINALIATEDSRFEDHSGNRP